MLQRRIDLKRKNPRAKQRFDRNKPYTLISYLSRQMKEEFGYEAWEEVIIETKIQPIFTNYNRKESE